MTLPTPSAGLPATAASPRIFSQSRKESVAQRLQRLLTQAEGTGGLQQPVDVYGDGLIRTLETRTAGLLGKDDAVFFPSGVMAQQVALRIWANRKGVNAVGVHALGHTELREAGALQAVAGLRSVHLTCAPAPLSADDVGRAGEPLAAVVLELPLRDAGFRLPTWEALETTIEAVEANGAAVHLDGARLWECPTHFGRGLAEIAARADSVYVSFYKALGGLSGAALAGDADFSQAARLLRQQYGGQLFQQFPVALAALAGLDHELPRLPDYVRRAREVARDLEEVFAERLGACRVSPQPPHTHQFQLQAPFPSDLLDAVGDWQADTWGEVLFGRWRSLEGSAWSATDVTVAETAMSWTRADLRRAAATFADRLRKQG